MCSSPTAIRNRTGSERLLGIPSWKTHMAAVSDRRTAKQDPVVWCAGRGGLLYVSSESNVLARESASPGRRLIAWRLPGSRLIGQQRSAGLMLNEFATLTHTTGTGHPTAMTPKEPLRERQTPQTPQQLRLLCQGWPAHAVQ